MTNSGIVSPVLNTATGYPLLDSDDQLFAAHTQPVNSILGPEGDIVSLAPVPVHVQVVLGDRVIILMSLPGCFLCTAFHMRNNASRSLHHTFAIVRYPSLYSRPSIFLANKWTTLTAHRTKPSSNTRFPGPTPTIHYDRSPTTRCAQDRSRVVRGPHYFSRLRPPASPRRHPVRFVRDRRRDRVRERRA